MATSSGLPSPTLSASSQQPHSFSSFQQRTSSSASGSHHSHPSSLDPRLQPPQSALGLEDFVGAPHRPSPTHADVHATPHASLAQPQPHPQFVRPMTTSPPPPVPSYVPPALYAMAPDPIHTTGWVAPGSAAAGSWRGGPYGPRVANGQAGIAGMAPNPLDGYPSSRASMSSTPGLQGMGYGRSGSSTGEPRDRRRYREDGEDEEVISTIFVVGFPEDMLEREFQNLFTFAPGFEAATLKFPSGLRREAAFIEQLNRLELAQSQLSPGAYEQDPTLVSNLEDSLASLTTSSTPSAAMSLTPSAPSTATLGPGSGPTRRQTIGFARFKTRPDALAARDLLQGRRIDALTGATLKAEMAKKNLHTKRQQVQDDVLSMALRSSRLSQLSAQQAHAMAAQASGMSGLSAGPYGSMPPPASAPAAPGPTAREAWESWPNAASASATAGVDAKVDRSMPPPPLPHFPSSSSSIPAASSQSHGSGSPPMSVQSPVGRAVDSKELLKLAEQADELAGDVWPPNLSDLNGYAGPTPPPGPPGRGPATHSGTHSAPIGIAGNVPQSAYGQYVPYGAYPQTSFGASPPADGVSLSINPADQNPPINTLYIGNLPATQSRDYPPNFLEESLRALFNMCPGFKRMSFRQKINGPMCFVEFEDIPFAAQAIHDLYGNTLHGMVKGGIRLSYSKNSLGQRGNAHNQGVNPAMFGGIAHTVALAGMSAAAVPGSGMGPNAVGLAGGPPSTSPPFQPQLADRRMSEASSLSPTAQPFNAPLPTSPRANRFYAAAAQPIPKPLSPPGDFLQQQSFSPTSPIRTPASLGWLSSANGFAPAGGATAIPGAPSAPGIAAGGGSASSASSASANGYGQSPTYGAAGGVFEPFGASQSLNGAASAWGGGSL